MNLEKLLEWRRSYRKFDEERELTKEDIDGILSSIKFASCANNRQFLRFISVESKEKVLEIFDNTRWAASLPNGAGRPKEGERPVYFIAILSDKEKKLKFDGVDQGLVISNLTLAAAEIGIGSCIIGSIVDDKMREILSYDDRYTCSLVVAFGYPKIDSSIKEINLEEDQSYYLDENGNYVVPKYKLDDIVRRI
ncbi:MAG: nitroreductase family protein [Peptoniphilus harei]|uniref:nitroreductase family protein n=1 Tax=Peptoniphilus harei TaxID=54005 RepID=UPI00290C2A8C|nr:nitroreductase family protein [Peptoniphilus harei]MDU5471495.1 nitroreductase family protein [Peptoniphilus harei]MDU6098720.1 nitroreductase family protein [Peptoniphilus harei]